MCLCNLCNVKLWLTHEDFLVLEKIMKDQKSSFHLEVQSAFKKKKKKKKKNLV